MLKRSVPQHARQGVTWRRARLLLQGLQNRESLTQAVLGNPPGVQHTRHVQSRVLCPLNRLPWLTVQARQHPHTSAPSEQSRPEPGSTPIWLGAPFPSIPKTACPAPLSLLSACLQVSTDCVHPATYGCLQ